MSFLRQRRLRILVALSLSFTPFTILLAETKAPRERKTTHFTGKVVRLSDELARSGVRLDADASPYWLALVMDDGKTYPLVKDGGSRMFYKDPRLLDRPMRLTGKLIDGTSLLQVTVVYSVVNGQLQEVYYWCGICSIKRFEKMICECCGDPMEFREEPVKP